MKRLLELYLSFRPFSDSEAWVLFKIAAILEACGWTILISGILISKYLTPNSTVAVNLAGHLHGTLFLIYIACVLTVTPSLRWKPLRIIVAGLMSVPPYGSLLFELCQAHNRYQDARWQLIYLSLRGKLSLAENEGFNNGSYDLGQGAPAPTG